MAKKQAKSRNLVIFTLVILVLLIALFVLTQLSNEAGKYQTFGSAPDLTGQPLLGNKDAKVTIYEFGDYKCPACKAWSTTVFPKLMKDYIDTGKANFSYINVLFHAEESRMSALAAESVLAQNPEAFWPYHDAIFHAQPDMESNWVTLNKMLEIAGTIQPAIDTAKLKSDIETLATQPQVSVDEALVKDYKIKQTPTIMINDVMLDDPFDYDAIVKLIEEKQ
ncbi:Disulfide bond formation protein D [Paenibacillus plantiphilus]|uniref:Disulfide bond formation protein D n=1 Tax=Paenibacillus plantiphilus TaxID=2905650 RepID=A0ABM9C0F1_9BACL|nr:DsbA family protein [Paenibacillus plantiphilus]CAH1197681.1 Disulfide bond formation protein D [Paenibacillus plantiphilus]